MGRVGLGATLCVLVAALGVVGCEFTTGSPEPDGGGAPTDALAGADVLQRGSAECAAYCNCVATTCVDPDAQPEDAVARCEAQCAGFTSTMLTCWSGWCASAQDIDDALSRSHACSHALGNLGVIECPGPVVDAGVDAAVASDAGADAGLDSSTDAGLDAAGLDAAVDAGVDAGLDAAVDAGAADAATDAGVDAGTDAAVDAGPPPTCGEFCTCMDQTCSSWSGYPYSDGPACMSACAGFAENDLRCWKLFCDFAATQDPMYRQHTCEHAWGLFGPLECS